MLSRTICNFNRSTHMSVFWRVRCYFSVSSQAVVDMASKDGELRLFIVAGEVSGDSIGSRLMASLKNLCPFPIRFVGVGGSLMSKQGLKSLFPMEHIAVMGIWELLPHLYKFRVKLKETVEAAFLFQPHAVVTIDSKGFSFRLLKLLRARYCRQGMVSPLHFHYVAPSFWAWKGGESRLRGLSEFIDHIFCILPFEDEVCKLNGVEATFVGHPVLEDVLGLHLGNGITFAGLHAQGDGEGFRNKHGISLGSTIISVLPGSRLQEVARMLSIFSSTMEMLKLAVPDLTNVVHVAPNQHVEDYIGRAAHQWPVPVVLIPGGSTNMKYDAFSASNLALCASGTVAMELQLARLPCVVAYRAHLLTEWFICFRAKIPYISLPNILLDSAIIPEALFQACTPSKLASILIQLMGNENLRREQVITAEKVTRLLWPSSQISGNSREKDSSAMFHDHTPSSIAASIILYFRKS